GLACQAPELFMEDSVELDIAIEVHVLEAAGLGSVQLDQKPLKLGHARWRNTAVGGETESRPLQDAPQLDSVDHVLPGEAAHGIAAGRNGLHRSLLFQSGEGSSEGSARNAQSLGEHQFGQACA